MTTARKEPSLIQKDLLAQKLVEPDFHLPQAGDSEADHLLGIIRIQAVTRREARKAAQDKNPLGQTADSLLVIIHKL